MQDTICRCDVCGMEKGDANDWFALAASSGFIVTPFASVRSERFLQLSEHICGQECLHKRLNQWLENFNRPAPVIQEEA